MFQPSISTKQASIVNSPFTFNLISGPRLASKSYGCLHDVPWHMWNTPGACGMMLGKTTTQNSDAGLWTLLINKVVPEWIAGDFGFDWVTKPRMEAVTHKLYFETTNRFDGVSRYYLDSLDVESDAEIKFKGKIFSHIYGTEFSHFKQRRTFDVLQECFRMPDLKPEQHKMVLDTNPAEEGTDSWLWKLFYWFRTLDLDAINDEIKEELNLTDLDPAEYSDAVEDLQALQKNINLIEFTIDDNIYITAAQKRAQRAKYLHNRDLLDRYYYGRWVRATGEGLFTESYRPEIHLIGQDSTPGDPEFLLPEEDCIELGTGSDIGRRNTAIVVIEPIQMEIVEETRKGPETVIKVGFKVLDEYVSLGTQQRIRDIAELAFLQKIEFWEDFCRKPPLWRHLSDNSAFSMDIISESDEAKEIYRATGGRVELESITDKFSGIKGHAIKGSGGVEKRVDMFQKLLFENRILVNAKKCPHFVEMLSSFKRNRLGKISGSDVFKHVFDAATYYMALKCWMEMIRVPRNLTNKDEARIVVARL